MANVAYKGSVTTSGSSDAIRFDKALFRQNPEFGRKTKVEAHVVGPGTMIVHVVDEMAEPSERPDPMVAVFLSFLEGDVSANPGNVVGFRESEMLAARALTAGVEVSDDDVIQDDVTF